MKDFTVIVGAPSAENNKAGEKPKSSPEKKEKVRIDIGSVLDSISDFLDSSENRFIEMENNKAEQSSKETADSSGLKPYVVILEATSVKEVPVNAASPDAAAKLVKEMYDTSDVIDFTDADVVSLTPKVIEVEKKSIDDFAVETMTELVRLIRTSDAPDDVLGKVLDHMFTEIFSSTDYVKS